MAIHNLEKLISVRISKQQAREFARVAARQGWRPSSYLRVLILKSLEDSKATIATPAK